MRTSGGIERDHDGGTRVMRGSRRMLAASAATAALLLTATAACGGGNPEASVRAVAAADDVARLFPGLAARKGFGAGALDESRSSILGGIPAAARRTPTLAERIDALFRNEEVVAHVRSVSADVVCGGLTTIVTEERFPTREEWVAHVGEGLVGVILDDEVAAWVAGALGGALWSETSQALDEDDDSLIELGDANEARLELGCSDALASW